MLHCLRNAATLLALLGGALFACSSAEDLTSTTFVEYRTPVSPAPTPLRSSSTVAASADRSQDEPIVHHIPLAAGMSPEQVLEVVGVPSQRMDAIGIWYFSGSYVQFVNEQVVAACEYDHRLHISVPAANIPLTAGMTKSQVLEAYGLPTRVLPSLDIWKYYLASIQFHDDKVIAVDDPTSTMVEPLPSPHWSAIRPGMTEQELLSQCGLPTSCSVSSGIWSYPLGAVTVRDGIVQSSTFNNPTTFPPAIAENGDRRGVDNDFDGRPEPVYVRGYFRKDGTYVRGHYRAKPRR